MGKNYSIYFNDKSEELIGSMEGKGTIINKLILEYFQNENEDYLRRKIENLEQDLDFHRKKLDKLIIERTTQQKNKELTEQEKELKKKKELIIETIKSLWGQEKINDDIYFGLFNNGVLDLEKAEKFLTEYKHLNT